MLSDSIDEGDQVINPMDEAKPKLLKERRSMDMPSEQELLPVMRAAHALVDPHVGKCTLLREWRR